MNMNIKSIILFLSLCLIFTGISNAASSKSTKKESRIVGGTAALKNEYPWMAALVYNGSRPYNSFCGASLIHPKWVMTAGHCMEGETIDSFKVVVGLSNLRTEVGSLRSVSQIVVHPDYDDYWLFSDIALIELTEPVNIQPIDLYHASEDITGKMLTVLGWGDLQEDGIGSDQLMEVSIPIVYDTSCQSVYPGEIDDSMFCAGLAEGGKDSCQGDSGGPAIIQEDQEWKLLGLVSWGEGCARPNYYGVYTRIPQFFSFVFSIVPTVNDLFTKTLSLSKGWNLVSLPYLPLESELNQIFSDASIAFTYSNYSYESTTQLLPGNGYWIKLPVAKNYTILGFQADVEIPQTNGWHLIGPTASDFNPVSIDNAAIEQIYAFGNGQYYEVNECPLGQACWVKINW